jgi:transposase
MEQAESGRIHLFFAGASHFVMGMFLGYVWPKVRQWVKTGSGRKRYNVLGALNFVTKTVETIVNDTYITSTEVMLLIDNLVEKYGGKPIKLILENVSYQRAEAVSEYAKGKVELVFLPAYSPNLNLIERLWKFVKSETLSMAYYEKFDDFKAKISSCLAQTATTYKNRITSLITANIQQFSEIRMSPT